MSKHLAKRVLRVGDIIWRRLHVNAIHGLYADVPLFPLTKDGHSYVIRANTTYSPVVNQDDMFVHPSEGILCFCPEAIPDDYTHFVVEAINVDGTQARVSPVSGRLWRLAKQYIWKKYCHSNGSRLIKMFGLNEYRLFDLYFFKLPHQAQHGDASGIDIYFPEDKYHDPYLQELIKRAHTNRNRLNNGQSVDQDRMQFNFLQQYLIGIARSK